MSIICGTKIKNSPISHLVQTDDNTMVLYGSFTTRYTEEDLKCESTTEPQENMFKCGWKSISRILVQSFIPVFSHPRRSIENKNDMNFRNEYKLDSSANLRERGYGRVCGEDFVRNGV